MSLFESTSIKSQQINLKSEYDVVYISGQFLICFHDLKPSQTMKINQNCLTAVRFHTFSPNPIFSSFLHNYCKNEPTKDPEVTNIDFINQNGPQTSLRGLLTLSKKLLPGFADHESGIEESRRPFGTKIPSREVRRGPHTKKILFSGLKRIGPWK
jgi:hypothetical protein